MKEKKITTLKRVMSGLIGFPIIALIFIFANDLIMDIVITITSLLGIHEFFKCFKTAKKANPSKWYAIILSVLLVFTHALSDQAFKEIMIIIIPLSLLVLTIELIISKGKKNINDIAITMLGICYVPLMLVFLSIIRGRFMNGKILIWYIFLASWGSDIFAYCIGKKWGKHKYTPISPNKSIEGCIAGIVGAVALALIYTIVINTMYATGINYLLVAIITIVLSIIGQVGDLAASSVKRYCDVKDFSELIPGHGGILDRIDSVIFIIPFAYILLGLLI